MHILLLSTVMQEKDFTSLLQKGEKPNPSNQHFYHALVKALSTFAHVDVLTSRPYTSLKGQYLKRETKTEEGVFFHYLPFWNLRGIKRCNIAYSPLYHYKKWIQKDTILFVDALHISLCQLAKRISQHYHVPMIGVITDHPKNLSNASLAYQEKVLKNWKLFDGYYCLTDALEKAANPYHRPSLVIEGIIERMNPSLSYADRLFDHYLFFGGALYERYGIETLLKAFSHWKTNYQLIIAGHGPAASMVKQYALKDPRIHYVGLLSQSEVQHYERNCCLNINPRPYQKTLDMLSVPSKVIEYIASGTPTLSTEHSRLKEIFRNDIFWMGKGESKDIYNALVDFMDTPKEEIEKKTISAQQKAYDLYSFSSVGKRIAAFLRDNISSSNFLEMTGKDKFD